MNVYGYVRDEKGEFEDRTKRVVEFAKIFDFKLNEIICEKSDKEYENMIEIQKLLKSKGGFILIVSDASDLFQDEYARMMISEDLNRKNVFLIDSYYPNLNYKAILDENSKMYPSDFLTNMIIVNLEIFFRLKNSGSNENVYCNDMRKRLEEWISGK